MENWRRRLYSIGKNKCLIRRSVIFQLLSRRFLEHKASKEGRFQTGLSNDSWSQTDYRRQNNHGKSQGYREGGQRYDAPGRGSVGGARADLPVARHWSGFWCKLLKMGLQRIWREKHFLCEWCKWLKNLKLVGRRELFPWGPSCFDNPGHTLTLYGPWKKWILP